MENASLSMNKRAAALPAGAAEEAEAGFIPAVVAGFGAESHLNRGRRQSNGYGKYANRAP